MKPWLIIPSLWRDGRRARRERTTRTYVFVFVPVLVDRGAQAASLQRRAACSSHSAFPYNERTIEEDAARQAAEQDRLAACAPQSQPFRTWFIDNPGARSAD